MKEQIRQNRGLLMLLAVLLVICLAAGLNTKSVHAASAKPALSIGNQGVVFVGEDDWDHSIRLTNLPKGIVSIKWTVSNKKIVRLDENQEYSKVEIDENDNIIDYYTGMYVCPKKAGSATITATITCRENGTNTKTYTAKKKVTVKKEPLKNVKIGKSVCDKKGKTIYNNKKGKLAVSFDKGWKIASITFSGMTGKDKKLKNGQMVSNPDNFSSLTIKLKNTKTKLVYNAYFRIYRYDNWKITYGKMKQNTALLWKRSPYGVDGFTTKETYTYKKNAKASEKYAFKNCKDLAKKLGYGATYKKNVITLKLPKIYEYKYSVQWSNGGTGCKVKQIKL